MTNREHQRQSNRDRYPNIAAFVDKCRRVFGPNQVKVDSIDERAHWEQATSPRTEVD